MSYLHEKVQDNVGAEKSFPWSTSKQQQQKSDLYPGNLDILLDMYEANLKDSDEIRSDDGQQIIGNTSYCVSSPPFDGQLDFSVWWHFDKRDFFF